MLTIGEIVKTLGGELNNGDLQERVSGISTDTRTIKKGELFVPLKGENFDGHDFIEEAYKKGAAGSLTQKQIEKHRGFKNLIHVEDTLKSLHKLAAYYRKKFNVPFVAVTGSSGKTTTKEMISSVLSQRKKVLKNQGNYNNHIGLPLTVFKLDTGIQVGVVEMGMSSLGEIEKLSRIVKPHVAVITNIGTAHIEKLGSREQILKAKTEVFQVMDNRGIAVLNGDDALLYSYGRNLKLRKYFFGFRRGDFQALNIKSHGLRGVEFDIKTKDKILKDFYVPLPGKHNVYNALAAVCVGMVFGLSPEEIKEGLKQTKREKMRLEISRGIKNCMIINDAYNANPDSMKAAVDVLVELAASAKKGRKIAVLGDMLEMGEWAPPWHIEVGKYAAQKGVDLLITVGKMAKFIAEGALETGMDSGNIASFINNEDVIEFLKTNLKENDKILIKGSRGMKMEQIAETFIGKERVK